MTASEQIQKYVASTRETAKQAEKEYDSAAREIEYKSQQNINLFGGSATRQVVEIAAMSRKACENLYASYQMLVRMLDENCRPLLAQNPSADSVKEVADLITWLNDESEIENNFSASFNSVSLGDVANVRFIPTVENKMIQQYWTQKYREMPDYEQAEQRRIAKQEEQRQARLKKKEEEKTRAHKWEEEKKVRDDHYKKALAACKSREKELEEELDQYIEEKKAVVMKVNTIMAEDLENQKTVAEESLAELDITQQHEKEQLDTYISELTERIAALQSFADEDEDIKKAKEKAKAASEEYKRQTTEYLKKRFPFDELLLKERRKSIPGEKREILDVLEQIGCGTVGDIMEAGGFEFSSQKCSALLRQLVLEGVVRREDIKRMAFFEIEKEVSKAASEKSLLQSGIDGFYEDTSVTDDDMPIPPKVDEVFDGIEFLTEEAAEKKAAEELLRMKKEDDEKKRRDEEAWIEETYNKAIRLAGSDNLNDLQTARELFGQISGKRDVQNALQECEDRIKFVEEEEAKKRKKTKLISVAAVIIVIVALGLYFGIQFKMKHDITKQLKSVQWYEFSSGMPETKLQFKDGGKAEMSSEYDALSGKWESSSDHTWSIDKIDKGEAVLMIDKDHKFIASRNADGVIEKITREDFDNIFEPRSDEEFEKLSSSLSSNTREEMYQQVLSKASKGDVDGLDDKLDELGDYKDCSEIKKELEEYNAIIESLTFSEAYVEREKFMPAVKYMNTSKYVKLPEGTEHFLKLVVPFLGKWTYSNGDDRLLSYTGKESSKHQSIRDIEIKYTAKAGTNEGTIQVFKDGSSNGMYISLPTINVNEETIEQGNYVGGDFTYKMKDADTLQISFKAKSGSSAPSEATVEYVRAD